MNKLKKILNIKLIEYNLKTANYFFLSYGKKITFLSDNKSISFTKKEGYALSFLNLEKDLLKFPLNLNFYSTFSIIKEVLYKLKNKNIILIKINNNYFKTFNLITRFEVLNLFLQLRLNYYLVNKILRVINFISTR